MLKDNLEIRGYGNMNTYGYIKHNEMSGYAIAHHGILGQKWGVRRYQNPDGSLTEAGKKRYLSEYGILKVSAHRYIDDDAYYRHQYEEKLKAQKKIPTPKRVTDSQINEIEKKIAQSNKTIEKKFSKWFGYTDVDEWLSDNVKDYDNLDWERQSDIQEDIIKRLEKKGYHFYD